MELLSHTVLTSILRRCGGSLVPGIGGTCDSVQDAQLGGRKMEQWCEVRPASQRPKTGPPGYCRGTPGLSGRLVGLHPLPRSGPDDGIPRRSFAPASIIIRPLRRTRRSRRTCPRASAGNMQGGSAGSCRRNSGSTPRTCVSDSPTAPDARPTAVKPRPLRRTTTAGTTSTPTFSACR